MREIFDNKFDLKLMYPRRDVFHISEFVAFAAVVIEYFARAGEWEPANSLYDALKQVAPDHPATKHAKAVLMRTVLSRSRPDPANGFPSLQAPIVQSRRRR